MSIHIKCYIIFLCFSVRIFIVTKGCLSLFDLSEIVHMRTHTHTFSLMRGPLKDTTSWERSKTHKAVNTHLSVCHLSLNPRSWRTLQINLHLYCSCCCVCVCVWPPSEYYVSISGPCETHGSIYADVASLLLQAIWKWHSFIFHVT